jgi:hypothetical protein
MIAGPVLQNRLFKIIELYCSGTRMVLETPLQALA